MSRFVFRLAWRETRGAWRHFGYFFACITLGVSALVGVGSFADSLERTVARSARALMGGDVEIRGTQPPPADAAPLLADVGRPRACARWWRWRRRARRRATSSSSRRWSRAIPSTARS